MPAKRNHGPARIVCAALAIALVVVQHGLSSASADAPESEAGVVVSNLPAKGTPQYNELIDLAGVTDSQELERTHAEMWLVPRRRLIALLKAAESKGVHVEQIDTSSSRVLMPMSKDTTMSAKQKDMMHKSMESKAAMGMSMMQLPDAAVMEYELTKGMHSPAGSPPSTLLIPLTDTLSVKAQATGVAKTGNGITWRGRIVGTDEPVVLLWWPGGRLAGTVHHAGRTYVIKSLGDGMHGVLELAPDKMPPDHGPADKKMMRKMNMRSDPLVHQGDASMLQPGVGSPEPTPKARQDTEAPQDAEIDLIVAYTKNAASNYDDIEKDLIEVAIAEANQSFRESGIDNVRVKLVHAYETNYAENGSHFDHVYRFRNKGDGFMDEIHGLRDKYGADIAALVVEDPMGCGLSIRVAADAGDAFTAVHQECAATMYSLAHEIGHLIGARHDRALDDTPLPFPYGHGYVHGNEWRTLMSYEDSCGDCPRRLIWSNPNVKVHDVPAGDADTDNAKVIREQAPRVGAFR